MRLSRRFMILIPLVCTLIASLACTFPFLPTLGTSSDTTVETGTLSADINYTDEFYREGFDYARDAPNVQHFVLVLPASEAERPDAWKVLYSIRFPEKDGDPWITDPDAQWAEQYLYEARGGVFTGEFAPGNYQVAAAFITKEPAHETRPMFGGASTELKPVYITAGQEAEIRVNMTDANGWACPWLYVFDGSEYVRRTEILRNVRGQEQTESTNLGTVPVVSSALFLRIREEKAETTYLDQIYLVVNGERIDLGDAVLDAQDDRAVILEEGAALDLRFALPESLALEDTVQVTVVVTGYYVAD